MKKNNDEIPLAEALRMSKAKGWPPVAMRDAVVRGEIRSRRSSTQKRARYYVRWADFERYVESTYVY